jgi:hypothetical protein
MFNNVVQVSVHLKARLVGLENLVRPRFECRKAHGRDGRTAQLQISYTPKNEKGQRWLALR